MFQAHTKYLTRLLLSPDVKYVFIWASRSASSDDGGFARYLATCSADHTVKIWSISPNYEFKLEKTMQGHQRWVWDCAFSADSAYLVTGASWCTETYDPYPSHLYVQHPRTTPLGCGTCQRGRQYDNTTDIRKVRKLYGRELTFTDTCSHQRRCVVRCTTGRASFAPRSPRVEGMQEVYTMVDGPFV